MQQETFWRFHGKDGNVYTVQEMKDKLKCDCIEYAQFGWCPHTLAVEKRFKPRIIVCREG
jgi:hypothetical protein